MAIAPSIDILGEPAPSVADERNLETVEMTINMGPQHPSTHGVFRMVLTIEGERVKNVQ